MKLPICPAFNDFKSYSLCTFTMLYFYLEDSIGTHIKQKRIENMECKFTLPMEISHSFAILSDDTSVHVIGGSNAQEQLFEKSEFLKMAKMLEMKLKNQVDEAILNYTKCIEQYDNICSIERDILIQKQRKKQQMKSKTLITMYRKDLMN
ncbi:hypothetical protein RFI_33736 [Reticulomyxa filosa]|uniref:Uncharacterized protein n=1 Tax=Reticulomyxa filosa TaxID=46433 RepID=X6LSD9_RETFI|nr:hypothetical protein RFI_33736 [Reticulomyxa filosa]|eukprot:ETO03665.1 hypothetical protein RFI_33736 [Reticulomyxa filosa]